MQRYPVYYEVTVWDEADKREEGGFIIATDFTDAMQQITNFYEPGLEKVSLEFMEDTSLIFSIEKARELKKWIGENHVY